ncbi:MAG TPA: tetratricopeptide repeat protein [Ktedonobacterales bacterium]
MNDPQGQQMDPLAQQNPSARAQEAMLRMAGDMQAQGHAHEAIEMYTKVLDDYPDSQAARAAANALMDLARSLEQSGQPRLALEIYQIVERYQ